MARERHRLTADQAMDLERLTERLFGLQGAYARTNRELDEFLRQTEVARTMSAHVAQLVAGWTGAAEAAEMAAKNIGVMNQRLGDQDRLIELRNQRRIQIGEDIRQIEMQAAIAVLPPWEQADAQIFASALERIRQIEIATEGFKDQNQLVARATSAIWAEAYAQMRNQVAASLEGLFDDITSGNIGRRFLNNFKRLIFQMVAEWIIGMKRMRAASQISFGGGVNGFLGSLFGALLGIPFGGGGGGGASSASATVGASSSAASVAGFPSAQFNPLGGFSSDRLLGSSLSGLGLSAGAGATSSLNLPAGASLGARLGAFAPGLFGMGGLSLASLVGFGRGPAAGALAGFLGTAGIVSAALLSQGLPLAGLSLLFTSAAGLATLGIGAAIGAILGLIFGGRKKRERERLERQLVTDIQKIQDGYKQHQIDFDSTIGQLEQMRAQYVQAQKQVGGGPVRRVHRHIDKAEQEIRAIEDERKRRQEVVFGPAEFHGGGIVAPHLAMISAARRGARAFHAGDVVNANLLVGESVLNRPATTLLGKQGVDRLNAGGRIGGEVMIQMIFPSVYDAKGFEHTLVNNMPAVVRVLRRLEAEGAF